MDTLKNWSVELAITVATSCLAVVAWVVSRAISSHDTKEKATEALRRSTAAHSRLEEFKTEIRGEVSALKVDIGKLETRIELMPSLVATEVLDRLGSAGLIDRRKS